MITLSVAAGSGVPGGSVTLAVSITSTGGDACTVVDFTFSFADLTLVIVNPGAAAGAKPINRIGNTLTVGGFDTDVFSDGILLYATFNIAASPSSNPIPITLTNISASDADANPLTTDSSAGSVALATAFPVPGLTLDPATGEINGIPTGTGEFCIRYRVTDSLGAIAETDGCCPIIVTTPSGGCFAPLSLLTPPPPTYGTLVCVGDTVVPKSLLPN